MMYSFYSRQHQAEVTKFIEVVQPGLYTVQTKTRIMDETDIMSGEEVFEMLKDDLMNFTFGSFCSSKAMNKEIFGFKFYPVQVVANDDPVLVAYNGKTNNVFALTLTEYHEQFEG
jgi:hypothetical protein